MIIILSNLRKMIKRNGLRMVEIAKRTGIKYKTVSRQCVTGIKTTRVARVYAKVLNCSPLELLD